MKTGDRIFKENKVGRIVQIFDSEKCTVKWSDNSMTRELFANIHLTPMQEATDIVSPLKNWFMVYFELSKKDITIVLNLIQIVGIILAAMLVGELLAVWIH